MELIEMFEDKVQRLKEGSVSYFSIEDVKDDKKLKMFYQSNSYVDSPQVIIETNSDNLQRVSSFLGSRSLEELSEVDFLVRTKLEHQLKAQYKRSDELGMNYFDLGYEYNASQDDEKKEI